MVGLCHDTFAKPVECVTHENPSVNYEPCVTVTYQCAFIHCNNCNNCTTFGGCR